MKYIKTYEGLLKGKSIDKIISELDGKHNNKKIVTLIKINRFDLLPRNEDGVCVYDGDLELYFSNLSLLPDNLTINGDLAFRHNNLTHLPDNLIVNGDLDCSDNHLIDLPNDLIVTGFLWCYNQKTGIKLELPKTAIVKGIFYN